MVLRSEILVNKNVLPTKNKPCPAVTLTYNCRKPTTSPASRYWARSR